MSKQVRWQIPFVSIQGVHYRVDIYDEQDGSWSGVTQLLGGETPFVTDEDDSDDYFEPIRTQSGTIEVCTLMPDGNYITLDDLLPANNIARPVKLWRILGDGAAGVLEWQGFLSCEAYDQDYTDIPQILDLPLISVLEAMASVQLDQTRSSGLQPIYVCLPDILKEIEIQSGMTCFTHINYSRTDYRILSKYIDMTVMFEQKEYNNENGTTYIVSGLSAKDALTRLCTYMGWIAREKGSEIYLQRIGEEIGMYREKIDEFPGVAQEISITEAGIAATFADKWRGTDHKRTVQQGAKSVEVVAKLEKYNIELSFPEFPYTDLSTFDVSMRTIVNNGYGSRITVYSIVSSNITFSNIHTFNQLALSNDKSTGTPTTIENVIGDAIINPNGAQYSSSYVGAFMARIKQDNEEYQDGIFLSFLGFVDHVRYSAYVPTLTNYTYSVRSTQSYYLSGGILKLKTEGVSFYGGDTGRCWSDGVGVIVKSACIKFGDKYWDGHQWVDSFTTVGYNPMFEDGYYIMPITSPMRGELQVFLYPNHDGTIIPADYEQGYEIGAFLTDLSIDYEVEDSDIYSDRSENHYFRLLGTNFRDEISVNTDLASMQNNQPSPSLIMNTTTDPMKVLDYSTSAEDPSIVESRRPEVDLLNRLATYYGAARQRLDLIVEHPTAAPLPLLRLNGISPDNRIYLPLAESRDWQQDSSTIKCFETPTEPA